jgi:PTS system mannose-specific IIA component
MIGVLIVTHRELAEALMSVYDLIMGSREGIQAVSLDPDASPEAIRQQIHKALALVNGQKTIILTDMLGGTPSNMSLPFLKEGKVEVITGINLPMLMKLPSVRDNDNLAEVVQALKESGQKGIAVASEVLTKRK